MAARAVRCMNFAKIGGAILRNTQHKTTLNGLAANVQKFQTIRSSYVLVNSALTKSCVKNFSIATTAMQHMTSSDPLSLIQNVDVRSPSSSSSASLTEGSGEDEDEQNCISPLYKEDVIRTVQGEAVTANDTGQIFAVVFIGGKQFKITINDTITIFRIDAGLGDRLKLEKILLVGGANFTVIGRPLLDQGLVSVEATVIEKTKTAKVIVFKKKKRKGYKRKRGHRQDITVLRINSIKISPFALSSKQYA